MWLEGRLSQDTKGAKQMIKQKLEILVESQIIEKTTEDYVLKVLDYLLATKIISDATKADVFLTHLAMADARRKKNESIASLDDFIVAEITGDPNFLHSKELWQDLEEMAENKFEEAELDYFYLHIINMLKED